MSIGMEPFASEGHFATYNPLAGAGTTMVFAVQCRSCGFEPEVAVTAPRVCPKCHANSWERFARPGSILENSSRY